jgi:dihydroorotate dehydrogenase (NAD+) catalytic subunit
MLQISRKMAKAAEAGGAEALSLINTLTGMKIDIKRRTFLLANKPEAYQARL